MKKIKIYQVDAFADKLFTGNPAAVCILEDWISEELMQAISAENNLAETAFVVPKGDKYDIRWFTPTTEVDLCGHATLAAGYVLLTQLQPEKSEIPFYSFRSGHLKVVRFEDQYFLDFPTDTLTVVNEKDQISSSINCRTIELYKGKTDYVAVIASEDELKTLNPDLTKISILKARGLIVTAPGKSVDFVSRFFAPQSGIDEDPVTGSAHTSLIPLWADKLGKCEMVANQLSKRGGQLFCINKGSRCWIGGKLRLYLIGNIFLD
jgi:phenazine biosynthesis protein PhzF family